MPSIRAVFFDIDGVLLDSLPQHLQICRDLAAEYGLSLAIPDVEEFRKLIARGVRISPMRSFFHAIGFDGRNLERAVEAYEREFMIRYRPRPFPGVDRLLRDLYDDGLKLGLVTSNTRRNVEPALGDSMQYFDSRCLFFFDSQTASLPKSNYLREGAHVLDMHPRVCVYIGDQPADEKAAREASFRFLSVSYGWAAMSSGDFGPAADSVAEIRSLLQSQDV